MTPPSPDSVPRSEADTGAALPPEDAHASSSPPSARFARDFAARDRSETVRSGSYGPRARIVYHPVLGRTLRVDDLATLGVSSQTLAEEAIAAGRAGEAQALVSYFHQEMSIMHGILITWIGDLTRYILERSSMPEGAARPVATQLLETWRLFPLGVALRERCLAAIHAAMGMEQLPDPAGAAEAVDLLDRMRLEFKGPHEVLVAWIQDLLAYAAAQWDEEAVLDSILQTYQSIWGDRYARWNELTPHERLALTVEGMRGGHFSGPRRRGDMLLFDEGDRYRMVMNPCGSGGVLRRGDPETGRPPHPAGDGGVNQVPHLWTWQKTGVHWYCTHCCISMEWLPGRQRGRPLRPLDHVLNPHAPCTWYVYKDEAATRAYHYPRSGLPVPPDAPDHGEQWDQEYGDS